MSNQYISVSEASQNSKISINTVRRWINKYKNNCEYVHKEDGKYLINSVLFYNDYLAINEYQESTHNKTKEIASFTLEKQNRDIISELIKQREVLKIPILRHSTFWVTVGFCVLIILLLFCCYFVDIFINRSFRSNIRWKLNYQKMF